MHPTIFREFENILNEQSEFIKGRVLEIGAVPTADSLLNIPVLSQASELVGINLDGGKSYKLGDKLKKRPYKILKANSNSMDCFSDDYFDVVLCNAVLEHDQFFWKTLSEINRIAKVGALIVIGVPGYDDLANVKIIEQRDHVRRNIIGDNNRLLGGTVVLKVHDWPGDFYRFSRQAVKQMFFEKCKNVTVYSMMIPPRIIGFGFNTK